jgi:hypothetical protein
MEGATSSHTQLWGANNSTKPVEFGDLRLVHLRQAYSGEDQNQEESQNLG